MSIYIPRSLIVIFNVSYFVCYIITDVNETKSRMNSDGVIDLLLGYRMCNNVCILGLVCITDLMRILVGFCVECRCTIREKFKKQYLH